MRRSTCLMALAASLTLAATGAAHAKPCRDAAGHYVACPAGAAASTTSKSANTATNAAGGTAKTTKSTSKKATGDMAAAAPSAGKNASAHAAAPAGAVSAKCKDGTVSHSQHRSGTCAGHGGVASWM